MTFQDTIPLMNSIDYKDRFRAEFYQLQIRIEKLRLMLDKYFNKELNFEPNCDYDLLHEQLVYMISYKNVMKERARIEKIQL